MLIVPEYNARSSDDLEWMQVNTDESPIHPDRAGSILVPSIIIAPKAFQAARTAMQHDMFWMQTYLNSFHESTFAFEPQFCLPACVLTLMMPAQELPISGSIVFQFLPHTARTLPQ